MPRRFNSLYPHFLFEKSVQSKVNLKSNHSMQTGLFSLILSCLLYATASYPQGKSILLNNLTIQNGLSSGSVICVLQDSEGFIWIGTEDGLNKFDGYQTQVYRHNVLMTNSIGGNSLRDRKSVV